MAVALAGNPAIAPVAQTYVDGETVDGVSRRHRVIPESRFG
jgi:hypothetical protein